MANTLAPRGLINPKLRVGGEPRTITRSVSSTYATDFCPGQLVRRRSDGFLIHVGVTTYTSVLGVCHSWLPNPNGQTKNPKDTKIQVVTDLLNTEWELQLSCAADASYEGNMVNILADAYLTKKETLRKFAPYMVGGTPATTSKMFRIIGFPADPKNEPKSANPRVRVQFNVNFTEQLRTVGV